MSAVGPDPIRSEPIRLMLVEDNKVFREALELLFELRPEIDVVAMYDNGATAIDNIRELRPDVVLMDYRLPGLDGAQATRAILDAYPETAVVCLTASVSSRETKAILEAGAVACLTKDEALDEIIGAIHRAANR
jgi:DNA-binding NarL/FixJ family response regulator